MRGGVVLYRGTGATARAYLEGEHTKADEYYLENGEATAEFRVLGGDGFRLREQDELANIGTLTPEQYQQWVDWIDPVTGVKRGEPRFETRISENGEMVKLPASPRFAEMTVNCDKSLSVAAFMFPEVSEALDQAQDAAADAMGRYMARNSVTRVGPKGAQEFVAVERFEEVRIRHQSSRAGDPHRHLHVQWNTRVFADGAWRGLWTVPTLKQQGALRGIGEVTLSGHQGLRDALAKNGLTFDGETGKVVELEEHSRLFSKRAAQVEQNLDRIEREWTAANPGKEPTREMRAKWHQTAWAEGRPMKVAATGSAVEGWVQETQAAGLQVDEFRGGSDRRASVHDLSQAEAMEHAVARLEEARSAWSVSDISGEVSLYAARQGVIARPGEIDSWVEAVAQKLAVSLPQLDTPYPDRTPHWVRHHTSERVLQVEADLKEFFAQGAKRSAHVPSRRTLTPKQEAARALGGKEPLVVIEGAAGSGKTTMLRHAVNIAKKDGRYLVVVAPSLIAANEAADALGTPAWSAHKLLHQHGWRTDEHGRWIVRLNVGEVDPETGVAYTGPKDDFRIKPGTRIVVDEAGMISQDVMHALTELRAETKARIGLVGDRAQLAAVGRGGVLHMAVEAHPTPFNLTEVHRFKDEEYAKLSLAMRDRESPVALFEKLHERGNIVIHDTIEDAREAVAAHSVKTVQAGGSVTVAVDTNDAAKYVNYRVQDERARLGYTQPVAHEAAGRDGLPVRIGDPIMTRHNDWKVGVANREVWQVAEVRPDQSITVTKETEHGTVESRTLPADYVREHTHLAYASTEHGVQGRTVDVGHGIVTEESTAPGVYVSATRGREMNTLHVVAPNAEVAREVFVEAMERNAGDIGTEQAQKVAARDLDGMSGSKTWTAEERANLQRHGIDVDKLDPGAADRVRSAAQHAQKHQDQAPAIDTTRGLGGGLER